jgi:methyl-accepting chemotaxis protein
MTGYWRITIGARLLAAVALAALLLAGLAGGVYSLLDGAAGAQGRALDAAWKQSAVSDARLEVAQMAALGRDLQGAQGPAELDAAMQRAGSLWARAREYVGHAERDPNGDIARAAAEAQAAAAAYHEALGRAAALRKQLLAARDEGFLPAARAFDVAMESVNGGLDLLMLPQASAADLRQRLQGVGSAAFDLRVGAAQYLATRDPGQRQLVLRGAATAAASLRAAQAIEAPAAFRAELAHLSSALGDLSDSARQVLALSDASLALAAETLAGAEQAAQQAMARADDVLSGISTREAISAERAMADAMRTLLVVASLIVLVQLLAGWLNARSIAQPLRAMVGAVKRIARGDTGRPVDFGRRQDEIGVMAAGLEELRRVVEASFAQGQMLDQLPAPVIVADPRDDFRITYLNKASLDAFRDLERVTGLKAEELKGRSIDVFHGPRAPVVRALLADPARLPHAARIRLGDETLQIRISAIRDREGAYVAPMLSWTNITQQVRLAETFEREVGAVVSAVGDAAGGMRHVAEALESSAAQAGMRATAVSAATDQAATSVQTVAASAEELAGSVQEIARQVAESTRIAAQAASEAQATDASVASLSDAAQKIGDVVRLIGNIASQTNLLALNATIEAARAGEAGKGFAVVAGEVKSLAGQTARATEEIAAQIAAMQGATAQAVDAIRSIGATISRMNEIATSIASAVEQQGAATAEIARSVQHASAGTAEVNANMGAVSEAVAGSGEQAREVLQAARRLSGESDRLQGQVSAFLSALRAA